MPVNKSIFFARQLLTIISILLLVCSACATHIDQMNMDTLIDEFKNGTIKLGSVTYGYRDYRNKMKMYYAEKNWELLAKAVIEGDQDYDVDWFYLGQAAEGLGFYKAAQIYYKKAVSTIYKCGSFLEPYGCDGFVFPKDAMDRLKQIEFKALIENLLK